MIGLFPAVTLCLGGGLGGGTGPTPPAGYAFVTTTDSNGNRISITTTDADGNRVFVVTRTS